MGNIWTAKPQNPKNRTLGNYAHAIVYDEPIDFHDKNRPKTKARPQIQIVNTLDRKDQKKGVRKRMRNREKKHPAPPEPKIRSPAKRKGFKKKVVAPPQVANLDDQTEEEKHEKIPKSSELKRRH